MERPAIYNQWPKPVVDQAFEKYPEEIRVVQYDCNGLDFSGMDMSDFEEDVNERPRIAYIRGFLDGWFRHLNDTKNESK